jgi:hypothetical protein
MVCAVVCRCSGLIVFVSRARDENVHAKLAWEPRPVAGFFLVCVRVLIAANPTQLLDRQIALGEGF